MRRRRILVLVVIFIILNVALAQEELDLNAESSEDNEQDQTLDNKGDEENGHDDKNKKDPPDIAYNDGTNEEDLEPSEGSEPSQTSKPFLISHISSDFTTSHIHGLPDQPKMHLDKPAVIKKFKQKEGCQCDEGLDCKCDNSTLANIECHCADFDNLAKVNEGYSCKCEKEVSHAVKLKCQCARKDSKVNVVKRITCTSTATFTQSHIRDITFGIDGKLQLYEKDDQEKKVVMTGIKDIKDIVNMLNGTIVVPIYENVQINLKHLKQIDIKELLKYFLRHDEFKLHHFNLCACVSNGDFEVCNCNDKQVIAYSENCLCVPTHNQTARVECMCNEHVLKPKIIYDPNVIEINKCECKKADNTNDTICKCAKDESYVYNYERIMVDIRDVEKDFILAVHTKLVETVEFKNSDMNICLCDYEKPNWNCDCKYPTDMYNSQNRLINCLCAGNHTVDSSECICDSHVLQPSILYNPTNINVCGCVCYNKNHLIDKSSLICECKQREDNRKKYDEVVLDISKIENANMSYVMNELQFHTVQFYSQEINYCECQDDNNLYCNCTLSTEEYTLEKPSQCLCMSKKSYNKGIECLCNLHLHDVNIIYAPAIKLQECTCSHFLISLTAAMCKCQNKESYTYDYNNALVDIAGWSKYSLATILVQLIHIVEYQRERFNLCACSKAYNGKLNCGCHDVTRPHTISNCVCITEGNYKYCTCSPNAHYFGIRYRQTDNNYIEVCTCDKGEKQKSLTCGKCHKKESVHVYSDKPFDGEITIPDNTENQFSIITNIIFDKFSRQDRKINKCQCSEDLKDCICEQNLKPYASPGGELRCLCIADYYYIERPLRCACNPHCRLTGLKFDDRMFDIRYCYAFAKRGNKDKTHCILQKTVPQYNYVIDITATGIVHANTIKEYIIQARREYNEEKFNVCNCKVTGTSFNCNCLENTEVYTESSRASCQCFLYGARGPAECICSPHILQFDIFFHAHQLDIDGCRCYHKRDADEKDLTCEECIRRTPIEKHPRWTINTSYHQKSVEIPFNTENQLDVIISFVLSIFQLNDRTFNHCECTNNFEDCTCRYPVRPYIQNEEKLHCLCLTDFYYNDKPMQCACNPHILQPKLIYPASKFHIRRVHCSAAIGRSNNVLCKPIDTGVLPHAADRVVINIVKSLVIHTKNIFEHIVTHPDYKHESFTSCTCTNTNKFECNCDTDTKIYNIKHQRNCLCVKPNDENQKVECLCNSIVLQFGIKFNLTTSNLYACHCYHSVDSNDDKELICPSFVKRESYEMHPHFGYDKNYTGIVKINSDVDNQITTIIALVVKQFSINDRVVNYCNCKENLADCKCEYPVLPYLLHSKKELNCLCAADYYYTVYPVRCGCNPYILQPKLDYEKTKYDFRLVTCVLSQNSQLICQQRNPESGSGLVNKKVVEITEFHIAHIIQLVEIILQNQGVIGKHINVCECEDNDDYLSCACKNPTHDLTITHSGSCLCLGAPSSQNKWNCLCNPHILQVGLIFDTKLHIQGCHCYKSIYNQNRMSLTCTQCEKRQSFEQNPRFDLSVSYNKTIYIAKDTENQLIVILNYMFDNLNFPIQNRIVNYCSCTEDLSDFNDSSDLICKCDRILLPYTRIDEKLHCLCVADYFYIDHPVRCACNPYVTQPKIVCNNNLFDLRYITCEVSTVKDKNNVKCMYNKDFKPAPNPEDKVVVRIKTEVLVNIVIIMEFILRRVEYVEEKFNLCSCTNDESYNCSCGSLTEMCTKASQCSCLCVIPRANAQDDKVECMCNPRVLQFGIQFNSTINHLEGCRCHQIVSENGKSIKCDNCVRRISYEHQLRFTTEKDYYVDRVIKIPPNIENQIEVIYRLIVQGFKTSDQIVNFCSCSEKLIDCKCENPMLKYRGHDGFLHCFCVADYFYDEHPLRCACNPLILQPQLVYNVTKYDFRYLHCINKDLKGLDLQCKFLSHGQIDPTHPLDRAVVTLKTPLRKHFADILEYIQTYKIYSLDVFNLCEDCKVQNAQIVCNCRQNTENHTMIQTASCLCLSDLGSAPECMCGPQILQIGILFHDITVEACRCYHSAQEKTNLNSLVCRQCHKKQLFEYNPVFSSNNYFVGSRIEDNVQNQIEYIYTIVVRKFVKNDQIVNICQCLPDLKTCNCKYAVEPYLVKGLMPCFCISDHYYTVYPYQCACNPFMLQPRMEWDTRKFEIRHLDCKMEVNSPKLVSCTEKPEGPKPPSAEYTFVMRLRNIEVTIKIIMQYLLQNELYKKEPLIPCDCKSEQGKYSCQCSKSATMYNIHNKGYCLCVTHKSKNPESTQCLCNSRILQFGIVFNSESNFLQGCKCYHSLNSNDEYSLICGECHERKSFEFNPHFDKGHNYTDKIIYIERFTEHQIHAIVQVIYKYFNSSDQFVNHCDCTEDMQECICDYPIAAYIQTNGKMPCFCVADYYYSSHPVRCAGNPFILQPEYKYEEEKYDIKLAECTQAKGSNKVVNCKLVRPSKPIPTMVLDTTVWREVQIKIIEEYIITYPQYRDERFNRCGCNWNDVNNEFTCDCGEDTSLYTIDNMCSCLCIMLPETKESLGCTCNARILQIGYYYKPTNDFYGCRCYHSKVSNTPKSLVCHSCEKIPSNEQHPHFKLTSNYTTLVKNISALIMQNRIEIIIPEIITVIPDHPHRLINYCNCRDDFTNCSCKFPVPPYMINSKLPCLCITDYFYSDFNLRCGCNPFVLQLRIIYDTSRYHFTKLYCRLGEDQYKIKDCMQVHEETHLSIDQVVVDIYSAREVTIQTIITYIIYHTQYKDEHYNICTCQRTGSSLSCVCNDPTVVCTIRDTCNCLCLGSHDKLTDIECMCNPLSLQFGVIFNDKYFTLEACRFYHPLHDQNTKSLIAHDCVTRKSFDVEPHFNTDYVYKITKIIGIPSTTENQLTYVLDIIRQYLKIRDRVFNRCECTENLSSCKCKHALRPYLQKNHKMPCLCIADYFYRNLPVQCGCNPFMFQVTIEILEYKESKFDFRWLECYEEGKSVSCTLVKRKGKGPSSADKVVFDMTRLVQVNIQIIIENILSYTQYFREHFNDCECNMIDNKLNCTCKDDTTSYKIEKRCSCLCYKFSNIADTTCTCNPHILQLGIVFNSSIVEIMACRCYHSLNQTNNLVLTCADCRKRDSFEVNPRFDKDKEYYYEVIISDLTENILTNILAVILLKMDFNDRIVNYCDCTENGRDCRCSYALEPFIGDVPHKMPCFCISDYYYLSHPLRCASNPFITQPRIIYNSRIFDFRAGSCTAYQGNKENVTCSFVSLGKGPQYPEYKYVIKIRDLNIVNLGIIKEFLIKSIEFKREEFNDCTCDSELLCNCNKLTNASNVHNKANCLCHKQLCICNPRILQIGIVFKQEEVTLLGCGCYHPLNSKNATTLRCGDCEPRESFERNPRFNLEVNYMGKKVEIPSDLENQIDIIFKIIIKKLEEEHQVVNNCECTGNLLECKCDFPPEPYSQINKKMPCFCMTDYYYRTHPVRCRCNPYVLQLEYIYDASIYDFIYADCVSENNDKDRVKCVGLPGSQLESIDQIVLDITYITVIHVTIITEHIFSFPEFRNEQFNLCTCKRYSNNELKCDTCRNDTTKLDIHNMRSCLCFTDNTKGQAYPECTCNAHILQIGIIYDIKKISWEGCRCYNGGFGDKSMHCIECHKIATLTDEPRFKLTVNYTSTANPVVIPTVTENQLIIIKKFIIEVLKKEDRFTNECYCTEDFTDCQCRNKIQFYLQLNNKMPCCCVADFFYNERPMRCACNPFVLQLTYKYDVTRFDFKYVECKAREKDNATICEVHKPTIPQPRPPADLVVIDILHMEVIDIKHIIENIRLYPQYHDHMSTCKCIKNEGILDCDCSEVTTQVTIQNRRSCLCLATSINETECICSARILQLGIIFDSKVHTILGCRCYHSIHNFETKTLICDDCIPRISFDHRPRFDLNRTEVYPVTLLNTTENILVNVLNVTLSKMEFNNRLVDYCACTEDLKDCSCKYPIGPYSVNNILLCFCIADYFYKFNPMRCGCNPFVLQPILSYAQTLYDIRHIHCSQHPKDSTKAICEQADTSPEPHNPEFKQVLRLRNVVVKITEIRNLLRANDVFKDERYNFCKCNFIDAIQTCECDDFTKQLTLHHKGNCLCVYEGVSVDCICNPRILQIGIIFDSSTVLKGCRCYHSSTDENTHSLICRDCERRVTFEMNPRFDRTTNYTNVVVRIPSSVTLEMDVVYTYVIKEFKERDKIVNHCECLSDFKHCKCDYLTEAYSRLEDLKMPCVCMKDYIGTYSVRCACNPFMMQPTLIFEGFELSHAECISINGSKNDVQCTEVDIQGPPPKWIGIVIKLHGKVYIEVIIEHLRMYRDEKEDRFNMCTCTAISENTVEDGLICKNCTDGAELYKASKNTSCLCTSAAEDNKNSPIECMCNRHVLQFTIIYDITYSKLLGCECYYSTKENKLICTKCKIKPSTATVPPFSNTNYTNKEIHIPVMAGVDVSIIGQIIASYFTVSDQFINYCHCTKDLEKCICDYSADSYARPDGKMYCVCTDDYYYMHSTRRCACNPFVWQPTYYYNPKKLNLLYMTCISRLGGALDCMSRNDTQQKISPELVLYDAKEIFQIDMNRIIEYVLGFAQYRDETMTVCSCALKGASYSCTGCSSDTVQYTILNTTNCLCRKSQVNLPVECVCNPFILQSEFLFDSKANELIGCRCYHETKDSNKDTMTCYQCIERKTYEKHPRFDLSRSYSNVTVNILKQTENNILSFLKFLVSKFKIEDQVVNYCKCTEDSKNCKCEYPIEPYLRKSYETKGLTMYCFCISDYFYNEFPIRCVCNPFILQPIIHFINNVHDVRRSNCNQNEEGGVTCKTFSSEGNNPLYRFAIKLRTLHVVNIGIIKEYLLRSEEYVDEPLNSCDCTYKDDNFECNECSKPTDMYPKNNKCNCLCVMPAEISNTSKVECLCGPHILQFGIVYNSDRTDMRGCRCYNKNGEGTLFCDDCEYRVSLELNPQFDLQVSYSHLVVKIEEVESQIDIILDIITNKFKQKHKIVNLCECTEDYMSCRCDYPIGPYIVANYLNCICILDHYYLDYPVRCGCNPYMFQPKLIYDKEEYLLRFVTCSDNGNEDKDDIACKLTAGNVNLNLPHGIVLNLRGTIEKHINTILEYIFAYVEHQGDKFNICKCNKKNGDLYCKCQEDIDTSSVMHNCLCLLSDSTTSSCMCNPRVQQYGLAFNTSFVTLESCRCYHRTAIDPDLKSLVCHECHNRDSIAAHVRFNYSHNYSNITVQTINDMEVHIESIIDIIVRHFFASDQIVNYCKCKENSHICTCEYPITNYLLPNGELHCACIDDFFDTIYPVRCGCNPFVTQPTSYYKIEQFTNESNYFNFRQRVCVPTDNDYSASCKSSSNDHPLNAAVVHLKHLQHINIEIIRKYFLMKREAEKYNSCNCKYEESGKLVCNCNNVNTQCSIRNPCNCLCIVKNNIPNCLCNPRVLQFGLSFKSDVELLGCRCYHSRFDKNSSNKLQCTECLRRTSIERAPRFDIDISYRHLSIIIPATLEKNTDSLITHIISRFEEMYQQVLTCKCTSDLTCECDYPYSLYAFDGMLNCLCMADKADKIHSLRCGCNPYILHPSLNLANWHNIDATRLNCSSPNADNNTVHCTGRRQPPFDGLVVIPPVPVIHGSLLVGILTKKEEFRNEPFTLCNCQHTVGKTLDCNCQNNTLAYTLENKYNCLCINNLKSVLYRPVVECICNAHIHQPRISFDENMAMMDKCRCYNDRRYDTFLKCECEKAASYKGTYHNNYGHVTIEVPQVSAEETSIKRLEQVRDVIIEKFAAEDKDYSHCRCMENIEKCTCAKSIEEYSYKTVTPCVCIPDNLNKTYPMACVCNRHLQQPKLKFDSQMYDLRDCDCFQHHGDMTNVSCHCSKKQSYESMESTHNYNSTIIEIPSTTEKRIEFVSQIILKAFAKADQIHNYCFCTEDLKECKCINPIMSYFYYSALPCFCMTETIMDYPVRCMCNRYILDPVVKYDDKIFEFQDCYFMLQHGDNIYPRCVKTTNPRTRPEWLTHLGFFANTNLQTKHITTENRTVMHNYTITGHNYTITTHNYTITKNVTHERTIKTHKKP